jgi:hypothetical protein
MRCHGELNNFKHNVLRIVEKYDVDPNNMLRFFLFKKKLVRNLNQCDRDSGTPQNSYPCRIACVIILFKIKF